MHRVNPQERKICVLFLSDICVIKLRSNLKAKNEPFLMYYCIQSGGSTIQLCDQICFLLLSFLIFLMYRISSNKGRPLIEAAALYSKIVIKTAL